MKQKMNLISQIGLSLMSLLIMGNIHAQNLATSSYAYISEYNETEKVYEVKEISKARAYLEISEDVKTFNLTSEMISLEGEIIEIEDVSENGDKRISMTVRLLSGKLCTVGISSANDIMSVTFPGKMRFKYRLDGHFIPNK